MLVKDKNSSELYIHVCPDANKYTRKALKERITVYRHDISAFIITDSGKIAKFLHCAPSSIYTHRSKIKKNALCPPEEFENEIMKITD